MGVPAAPDPMRPAGRGTGGATWGLTIRLGVHGLGSYVRWPEDAPTVEREYRLKP